MNGTSAEQLINNPPQGQARLPGPEVLGLKSSQRDQGSHWPHRTLQWSRVPPGASGVECLLRRQARDGGRKTSFILSTLEGGMVKGHCL